MKDSSSQTRWFAPRRALLAGLLALLSSVGSISVAVAAGWQRGAVLADQMMFAGVNAIAVLAAQFLPALGAHLAPVKRTACLALWSMCIAYTALGHAWYLLAAQERAGMVRARTVMVAQTPPAASSRSLSTILNDKADATQQLARLSAWACEPACAGRQRLRKAALDERLAALDAEAEATVTLSQSRLRLEGEVRQAKDDLVGARLAVSLGLPYETVTWMTALIFALILEGVGCFCWTVVLNTETTASSVTIESEVARPEEARLARILDSAATEVTHGIEDVRQKSLAQVPLRTDDRDSSDSTPSRERSFDEDVTRVTKAIQESVIELTVTQVRQLLRCGQQHARDVRKFIADTASHP